MVPLDKAPADVMFLDDDLFLLTVSVVSFNVIVYIRTFYCPVVLISLVHHKITYPCNRN